MSMLERLSEPSSWERFYEYKTNLACPKDFAKELRAFIDEKAYEPVCAAIAEGKPFPKPRKTVISKMHSTKKRVVYTYPRAENTVLKLLTYLLLRKYDGIYSDGLYSFRPNRSAKDAVKKLRSIRGMKEKYAYKVDISNYFNSVPIPKFIPMLEEILADDRPLFEFLKDLLEEPEVLEGRGTTTEEKGIMAGTPQASFYANVYLMGLDRHFAESGIPYARYSDDIIVFTDTREEAEAAAAYIKAFLAEMGLSVNPDKEEYFTPEKGWVFLGFSYRRGVMDIAPASIVKIKHKMRRKTRALKRWSDRNDIAGEKAAAAFIRIFNRKLLESAADNDLTWSYWFFTVINTTDGLKIIDEYARECVRYLISGKHTKARFKVKYEDMKKLGYRNLVHAYYEFIKSKKE